MTSFEFREMLQGHLCLRGNSFSQKVTNGRGELVGLLPKHPDSLDSITPGRDGLVYTFKEDSVLRSYSQDQIFHLRGMGSDGIMGDSPIRIAANAIGMAMSAEEHGGSFFANGAHVKGVLEHPGPMSQEAQRRVKSDINSGHGGTGNAGSTLVLHSGMKWHEIGVNNKDAQYIEARKFQISEIARIFRVPLHLLGENDKAATYASVEQFGITFVTHTIRPWAVRIEQAIQRDLIDDPDYFAEFSLEGLLRGDSAARAAWYHTGREMSLYTANDIRRLENMDPVGPEGDDLNVPANWKVLGAPEPEIAPPATIEPAGDDEPAEDNLEDKSEQQEAIVSDMARRITACEVRMIGGRLDKQSADPERYAAWVEDTYEKGVRPYMIRTLAPLFAGTRSDVSALASRLIDRNLEAVKGPGSAERVRHIEAVGHMLTSHEITMELLDSKGSI